METQAVASVQPRFTVSQFARLSKKKRLALAPQPPRVEGAHSHFLAEIRDRDGKLKWSGAWRHNLTTDTAAGFTNRRDWQSKAFADASVAATYTGAATSMSATVLTNTGAAFATAGQGLAGRMVAVGPNSAGAGSTVYGIIQSNTATALTVAEWLSAGTNLIGTTPNGTATYSVLPGQAPAAWVAVTATATAPTSADTVIAGEATTNGFIRALATFAHTAAATTYTQTKVFTATGSLTPAVAGVFANSLSGTGAMPFTSAIPSPPVLVSSDTMTLTITVTI